METQNLETNPYAYLEREEFSSERYKISIKNLPKYYGVNEMKKLLNDKLKLASNKIKFPKRNNPFIFVSFRSEDDRENGIKTINGYKWKGKVLSAHVAMPAPDPLVKRRNEQDDEDASAKKIKVDDRPQEERLKLSTVPLCDTPYDEQLSIKQEEMRKVLVKLGHNLGDNNVVLKKWVHQQKCDNNQVPCELLDIRHSSVQDGYRNKCEFTVGVDEETSLPTVGFRISSYAKGGTGVAPVENLRHIPSEMKVAVKVFQDFVRNSSLEVFNPEFQSGNYRQLTVRCAPQQLMLVVGIHPQSLPEEKLAECKNELVDYFFQGPGKCANVTSLYYQKIIKKQSNDDINLAEHLYGDTHINESILDLKFRISPEAFFQINTSAAEILYKSAIELAEPNENTTVVDICCGTGTIGLCFAKHCNQVLGIELVAQAVADAKENAKSNGIDNCEFFCGKAEDLLNSVLYRVKNEDIIAVVDPPRAGLHHKAILQLRKATKIKKLVYISCNANAAMKNFVDLGRRPSKTIDGDPFVPVKAVAVDLFPHTKHCELVILFERWDLDKLKIGTSVDTQHLSKTASDKDE
uniref:tRNA (uracil(54)-C(5))-methyltransferase n=3 Tax=Photinus pyralis TaxID=7054 RepID=A0A1Y1LUL4_PHOPY